MFQPFLLIGVGGSGGKTLRSLRQDLLRRLEEVGWDEGFPRAWQMVHIDVPTTQDGDDPDLPEQLPIKDYQGLVARNIAYRNLDEVLQRGAGTEARSGLVGWRPQVREVQVPVERGAGQYRAVGRLITIAALSQVKEALERCLDELQHPEVSGELGRLAQRFGAEPSESSASPTAIVVSSIAGGSGAGAVIDVCDVLRALRPGWGDHSIGLLYAPDVFDEIPAEHRKGIRPNALATMAELMSGYWNGGGPSEADTALMHMGMVAAPNASRLGPRYPLLVGKRSSKVDFGRQVDVYNAMGRALAAWLTSQHLQDVLGAYFQTNWSAAAAGVTDETPLNVVGQEPPFSALGFARLSLGRDRFREYAAQSLAKLAVERVLRCHLAARTRDDDRTPEELLEEHVDYAFGPFLIASGLNERGSEHNDVLQALTDSAGRRTRLRALEDLVADEVRTAAGTQARDRRWWRDRIVVMVRERADEAVRVERDAVHAAARQWVRDIEERITSLVAVTVAEQGGPVTARLLRRLRDEVDASLSQWSADVEKFARLASTSQQEVDAVLATPGAAQLPATHGTVPLAVTEAVKQVRCRAEIVTREVALDLLRDLEAGLLLPLEEAVREAAQRLQHAETDKVDGRPSQVQSWAPLDAVPARLAPARNEFLLEPVDRYPAERDRLLVKTTGVTDVGGAQRRAVTEILLHDPRSAARLGAALRDQYLVRRSSRWVPRTPELRPLEKDTPSRARFTLQLEPAGLLQRAKGWIGRPDTEFGQHLAQTLGPYFEDERVEPTERARRLQGFQGKLQAALDSAAPLVEVNAGVLSVVHHRTAPPSTVVVSGLPLRPGSEAYEAALRVFVSRGITGDTARRSFREAPASYVDIFTVQNEPYQPVVFDSLMRPLAEEWGARSGSADGRASFWRWRRARPLPEFVPADPRVRAAMVRGWFTAGLLGQLQLPDDGRLAVLADAPGGAVWQSFPFPTLTTARPAARYDYLPIVLESLPLAYLQVNREASVQGLAPYGRLLELGTSGDGGVERYEELNEELHGWLMSGAARGSGPVDPALVAATGPESRRDAVVAYLQELQANYDSLFRDVDPRDDARRVPLVWELRDDVTNALGHLVRVTSDLRVQKPIRW